MYNHNYSHSNSQGNERQPIQDTTNDQYTDEWPLRTNYDYLSYPGNGNQQYPDAVCFSPLYSTSDIPTERYNKVHAPQAIPISPSATSASDMYTQQMNTQMLHPTWQQYNTSYAVAPGYTYQHPTQHFQYTDINSAAAMAPSPILYDMNAAMQNYEQSYAPVSSTHRTRPVLPLPVATNPASPVLRSPRSPRSYPPSPQAHTPSPMGSPSSASMQMYSGYPYSPMAPAPPPMPASPPSPPPHIPHILPHPQPAMQRWRVPQTLEAGHSNSKVEFRVNGVLGIRVQDAIRNFVEIDAGEDRVLARIGARTIRLALHWPGCQPVGSYVTVKDDGQPVTRKQFANRVSVAIARMLTKVAKTQHANARFLLGTNGINTNNLWLQYVIPASQNMWIAELETEVNANNT
ncbi:hypothetical protein BC629DRAFT_1589583 [Irpex lacteus]|nr:hypothetical protein BC629DRAFT_1589583 [Irpex lacteus]